MQASLSTFHKKRSHRRRNGLLPRDGTVYSYIVNPPRTLPVGDQTFTCTQSALTSAWLSTSTTLNTYIGLVFALNQVDQVSEFAAVFDQYRIDSVEVYISNEGSNLNITNTGRLITVIDYDDANALSTIGQATDYPSATISSCQSCQYRHFVPRMAVGAFTGSVFTGYSNQAPQWIDMASTNVQHYGLKAACTPTSSVMVFDLQIRFHLSFRTIR